MAESPVRLRRSALYMPASNARAIAKARSLPCDVVILDLEDAVAPDAKETARAQALAALREGGFGARELVVRCNGLDTPWAQDDLAALGKAGCTAVLAPKVSSAAQVSAYLAALPAGTQLWAMIETAQAVLALQEIAAADPRLRCLVLGTNDLVRELRAQPPPDRATLLPYLAMAVAAARAAGIDVLDAVYNHLDDLPGFDAECRQALQLGFDGKTLIHPSQIEPCNAVFAPSPDAVAWAQAILAAFDRPENAGLGAIRVEGRMVERLHLEQARRTVALSQAARTAFHSIG